MTDPVLITVELCGKLAEPCGPTVAVAIPAAGCSADELRARVAEHDPALGALLAETCVRLCINESVATGQPHIIPGDLVALMPPVSGG